MWVWAALAVPVSSILGLLRPILEEGLGFLGRMWTANAWADLVFAAGTVATVWLSASLAQGHGRPTGGRFTGAVLAAFAATYATYLVSAALADGSLAKGAGLFGFRPTLDASGFLKVLVAGLPGLVGMSFAGPLVGLFVSPGGRRPAEGYDAG